MRVREIMTRHPATIAPEAPVAAALAAMRRGKTRHLPVVDADGRLVGCISEGDLKPSLDARIHAMEEAGQDLIVQDVMTCPVVSIGPEALLADAVALVLAREVESLPVVEAGRLVGLLTEFDVLRALDAA